MNQSLKNTTGVRKVNWKMLKCIKYFSEIRVVFALAKELKKKGRGKVIFQNPKKSCVSDFPLSVVYTPKRGELQICNAFKMGTLEEDVLQAAW